MPATVPTLGVSLDRILELLIDTHSAAGLAVTTLAIVLVAAGLRVIAVPLVRRRFADDPYRRYRSAKIVTYVIAAVAVALFFLAATTGAHDNRDSDPNPSRVTR